MFMLSDDVAICQCYLLPKPGGHNWTELSREERKRMHWHHASGVIQTIVVLGILHLGLH